jgi:hypothetical protein
MHGMGICACSDRNEDIPPPVLLRAPGARGLPLRTITHVCMPTSVPAHARLHAYVGVLACICGRARALAQPCTRACGSECRASSMQTTRTNAINPAMCFVEQYLISVPRAIPTNVSYVLRAAHVVSHSCTHAHAVTVSILSAFQLHQPLHPVQETYPSSSAL